MKNIRISVSLTMRTASYHCSFFMRKLYYSVRDEHIHNKVKSIISQSPFVTRFENNIFLNMKWYDMDKLAQKSNEMVEV